MKALFLKDHKFEEIQPGIWRVEPNGKRRVGVHLVGSPQLLERIKNDRSIDQALNVACLPGVQDPVLAMPDIHQGYGFPIGGVAAFHPKTGVVSPGGVGYDINCGVRLLKTDLTVDAVRSKLKAVVDDIFDAVPAGVGSKRNDISIRAAELDDVLAGGANWAISRKFGTQSDLEFIEERGCLRDADPSKVSDRAKERGLYQIGTLGSGNHFVEVQYVDEIYDAETASHFGLVKGNVTVSIHTGSRGLGYQVCSDYLESTLQAAKKYDLYLPERELAAAPIESPEGKDYIGAMYAAANFAFANRQVIAHWVQGTMNRHFPKAEISTLYDVCHNIAKFEEFERGRFCVHRKGATRAYPGQPVIVPGDMGRYSFVMVGTRESLKNTFGSACHGAGRELSRTQAKKIGKGRPLVRELADKGIIVKTAGRDTVLEEMPEAYKDVAEVVAATQNAQIAKMVARLRPLGVVKG